MVAPRFSMTLLDERPLEVRFRGTTCPDRPLQVRLRPA
jgi:hypothetical protein